jgi:hypothetical protein
MPYERIEESRRARVEGSVQECRGQRRDQDFLLTVAAHLSSLPSELAHTHALEQIEPAPRRHLPLGEKCTLFVRETEGNSHHRSQPRGSLRVETWASDSQKAKASADRCDALHGNLRDPAPFPAGILIDTVHRRSVGSPRNRCSRQSPTDSSRCLSRMVCTRASQLSRAKTSR